jgi:C_GCAxxG_C_C family probable redox protein
MGIKSELIPRIATGFSGGIARSNNMCGAVSGAVMAVNLALGRDLPDDPREKDYEVVQKLLRVFEGRFGALNCGELLGCDLGTREGLEFFVANNLRQRCRGYAEEAAALAISLLGEHA